MKVMKLLMFIMAVVLTVAGASNASMTNLVERGSLWDYKTLDFDLRTNWSNINYSSIDWDSSSWSEGYAAFGTNYPSGGLNDNINTVWVANTDLALQTSFELVGNISGLTLNVAADNGFIVFVNGTEVARAEAEGYTSYWEYSYSVDPYLLSSGTNTISVLAEDHGGQTYFDLELNAIAVPAPGAMLLAGFGTTIVGTMRRRRM